MPPVIEDVRVDSWIPSRIRPDNLKGHKLTERRGSVALIFGLKITDVLLNRLSLYDADN